MDYDEQVLHLLGHLTTIKKYLQDGIGKEKIIRSIDRVLAFYSKEKESDSL